MIMSATRSEINDPYRPVARWLSLMRDSVRFMRILRMKLVLGRKLKIGKDCVVARGCFFAPPDRFELGNKVAVGAYFHLEQNLVIGDDVLISCYVSVIGNDHPFDDPSFTVYSSPRGPASTVILEGDNLIGFGSTIIGNVRIGKGCIIGAKSVVTRDMPPYTVCAGSPARPIRKRFRGEILLASQDH